MGCTGSDIQHLNGRILSVMSRESDDSLTENGILNQNRMILDQKSIISIDSFQTADRLLDKLDLSVEDELLLQQALKEEEQRALTHPDNQRDKYYGNTLISKAMTEYTSPSKSRHVLCVPASTFPSLRHSSSSVLSGQRDRILQNLKDDPKLATSKGAVIENHVSRFRYSYLVQEGSDDEAENCDTFTGEEPSHSPTSENGNPNYRRIGYNKEVGEPELAASKTKDSVGASHSVMAMSNKDSCNAVFSHTPANSMSTMMLNHTNTMLSLDSEVTVNTSGHIANVPNISSNTLLSTPGNRDSSHESFEKTSPPNTFVSAAAPTAQRGNHKKKSSFSLKNLFKSPKSSQSSLKSPTQTEFDVHSEGTQGLQNHPTPTKSAPRCTSLPSTASKIPASPPLPPPTPSSSPPPLLATQKSGHSYKLLIEPRPMLSVVPSSDSVFPPGSAGSSKNHYHNPNNSISTIGSIPNSARPSCSYFPLDPHRQQQTTPGSAGSNTAAPSASPKSVQAPNPTNFPKEIDRQRALDIIAEQKLSAAMESRSKGNFEDSTKLLHEAGLMGSKTACLLYGLALRHGVGSAVNLQQSFNWLFKATGVKNEAEEILSFSIDPAKLVAPPSPSYEPEVAALYECGISYFKNYGKSEVNELKALKYLEKAASLGHIDSICLCGSIWLNKSKYRPRNPYRAAAWLRLARYLGVELLSADWIYEEKYMSASIQPKLSEFDRLRRQRRYARQ